MNKPNILWLIAEDMCPNLGCYGDPDAITPNLDALATEGIRYTNVSSVGPVCSAARTTLALGLYPTTAGVGNHRSHVEVPEYVRIFSEYLQDEGYFTAINKTDYNFCETYINGKIRGWDRIMDNEFFRDSEVVVEGLAKTWRQRSEGHPFFIMNTFAVTHQSKYGYPGNPEAHRKKIIPRTKPEHYRDRDKLTIPFYHTDNPDTREIWGQYHESITAMDRMVGETIDHLKEEGLYEDTIIFFFGDNGMGIPGGKFAMWNEGTSVPLIVRVPDKYKDLVSDYGPGQILEDPVDFTDLTRTTLVLGGAKCPDYLQGRDFLNLKKSDERPYNVSYRNRIDSSCEVIRSVRDDRYLYIRNFYPQKGWRYSPYMAYCSPYFMVPNELDVKAEFGPKDQVNRKNAFYMPIKPIEELYDLVEDPDQMNNLAEGIEHMATIELMRARLKNWIQVNRDGGLMMEQELRKLAKESSSYHVLRNEAYYPIEMVLEICDSMLEKDTPIDKLLKWLDHDNATVRYWAVQALHAKGDFSKEVLDGLTRVLEDSSEMVGLAAGETLVFSGFDDDKKAQTFIQECLLNKEDILLPLEALDCLDRMGPRLEGLMPRTDNLMHHGRITNDQAIGRYERAVTTLARFMSEKWQNHFDYTDLEEGVAERLLIFRALREEVELVDMGISV